MKRGTVGPVRETLVVLLPPGINPFAVQLHNDNNNNNNNIIPADPEDGDMFFRNVGYSSRTQDTLFFALKFIL
jgi:hypothetical protein